MNWKTGFLFFARFPEAFVLITASFITRFWSISLPAKVAFDETHFGLYATKYLTGQFYFDIHPPLGKMILGFVAWIAGAVPGFDFLIGSSYPDTIPYVALRAVPAFFGALLVPLAYLIARELNLSRKVQFLVGFLVLLDNALLLHSRVILLDSMMLFFILLSVYLFLRFLSSRSWALLFLCGISAGLAGSVKWIGFAVLAIVWIYLVFEEHLDRQASKKQLPYLFSLLFVPLMLYTAIFGIHLMLVRDACVENCGSVLQDKEAVFNTPTEGTIVQQFMQQHSYMAFSTILAESSEFSLSSRWYSWPLMHKGFYFGAEESGNTTWSTFLTGNPIVWYLSSMGVVAFVLILLGSARRKKDFHAFKSPGVFLVFAAYLVFLLFFIPIQRFSMLYHYFPALLFAIFLFGIALDQFFSRFSRKAVYAIYGAILVAAVAGFAYVAPLSYGSPLKKEDRDARVRLLSWPQRIFPSLISSFTTP